MVKQSHNFVKSVYWVEKSIVKRISIKRTIGLFTKRNPYRHSDVILYADDNPLISSDSHPIRQTIRNM